jgi:hypothetical protein
MMASKRQAIHIFSVFIDFSDQRTEMPFMGISEPRAAQAFYQAVLSAQADPLAYQITMRRDARLWTQVQVKTAVVA